MTSELSVPAALDVQLQEANTHHQNGHWDEAEQGYRAILQAQPQHTQANYNLGVLYLQHAQPLLAKPCFSKALESAPDLEQCWLANIEVLIQTGQLASAGSLLMEAQQRFGQSEALQEMAERLAAVCSTEQNSAPAEPDAREMDELIGLCAMQRYEEAERPARELTERFPDHPFGWKALGVVLEQSGRPEEALTPMIRSVELQPEDPESHFNLGNVYKSLRRMAQAEDSYRQALDINPAMDQVYTNLGGLLYDMRRLEEAEASYRQALEIRPDNIEAENALGVVLHHMERYTEAEACYRQVLAVNPDYVKAINNLGITLAAEGRWDEAEQQFRTAIDKSPDCAQAYGEFGGSLLNRGKTDEAEEFLLKAIEIDPNYAEAYSNLGVLAARKRRLSDAENYYRRALQIKPGYLTAIGNLGSLLKDLGKGEEGIALLRQLASSKSSELWMHSNLLFSMTHDENVNPQVLYREHRAFGEKVEADVSATLLHTNTRNPERKLRIGFVSGDLCDHPVMLFIEPIWRLLNKQQYAIYAYSNRGQEDDKSRLLRSYAAAWRNVHGLSDRSLATLIQEDQIDILVDLSGHTGGTRLPMFALKPAPIQASWVGYPATTGLQAMDYYLVDKFCAPPGLLDEQFVEKLVRLPAAWAFQPAGKVPLSIPPALYSDNFTFGSFNRVSKLTDRSVKLWSRVLQELPSAHMLLGGVEEKEAEKHLISRFEASGIDPQRLVFHPRVSFEEYLKLHNQVDLLLDSIPYTGGTTTNHGLWMGVPTLTLAGATLPGRQGAALMNHVGLPEFVAGSEDDFVSKAVAWSRNVPELTMIRAGMRVRINNSELRTPAKVTQGVESAFREMWRRWCRGESPESFDVE